MLYPLKFIPRLKERIWGGKALETELGKELPAGTNFGESWEISGLAGDISVVAEGELEGNNLQELVETYMGDLVGDHIYEKFGVEFPLLIKFIDARENLSIQVHPDDELAMDLHDSYGKTEMWYVIAADPGAALYVGFNRDVTPQEFLDAAADGTLPSLLNRIEVAPGEAYFIPAGTIHAVGQGVLVAEIQETSDITYRVYDWGRKDEDGKPRELHTEAAVSALDFSRGKDLSVTAVPVTNKAAQLVECEYFTTNIIAVEDSCERDYSEVDSFVIYICLDGDMAVCFSAGAVELRKGETLLIPRQEDFIEIDGNGTILEVFIK